ncbi:MAG: ABC transporter permease [Microthrixaceae bacterium]|nr:ABC transporter permease [Microthrixaceae bacterium]
MSEAVIEEGTGELTGGVKRGGSAEARAVTRFGGMGDVVLKVLAWGTLLFLFLPIFVIIAFSFNDPAGKFNLKWQSFTFDNWADPFKYEQLNTAFLNSLEIALVSTLLSVVIGSFLAIALVRQRFLGRETLDTFLVLPLTVAEVVIGASLLTLFLDLGWNRGFWTIVLAHVAFQLSFVALTIRARVRGHDWTTEDAALDLGAGPVRTFTRVTLPLIFPGIVAAALLAFALSLDDFIITFFNAGSTLTYPLFVNAAVKNGLPPQVNVLATAILLGSLAVIGAGSLWARRRGDT